MNASIVSFKMLNSLGIGALSYGRSYMYFEVIPSAQRCDVIISPSIYTVQIASSSIYVSIWLGRVWSNLFCSNFFFVPFNRLWSWWCKLPQFEWSTCDFVAAWTPTCGEEFVQVAPQPVMEAVSNPEEISGTFTVAVSTKGFSTLGVQWESMKAVGQWFSKYSKGLSNSSTKSTRVQGLKRMTFWWLLTESKVWICCKRRCVMSYQISCFDRQSSQKGSSDIVKGRCDGDEAGLLERFIGSHGQWPRSLWSNSWMECPTHHSCCECWRSHHWVEWHVLQRFWTCKAPWETEPGEDPHRLAVSIRPRWHAHLGRLEPSVF